MWSQRKVEGEDEGEGVGEDEDEIEVHIETMTDMAIEDVRHRACLVGRLQEQQIRFGRLEQLPLQRSPEQRIACRQWAKDKMLESGRSRLHKVLLILLRSVRASLEVHSIVHRIVWEQYASHGIEHVESSGRYGAGHATTCHEQTACSCRAEDCCFKRWWIKRWYSEHPAVTK